MVYDIAVIGGGPTGSSFGVYAKKLGLSVILFEREKFPRDHVGESMVPFLYWNLKEMGVWEKVKKHSALKPGVNFMDADGSRSSMWHFNKIIKDESSFSFHTVRSAFDKTLLDNATELGVVTMEEHRVMDVNLKNENNQVTVTVKDKDNNTHTFESKFLIDASGCDSFLAKKFNTKKTYADLDRVSFLTHWIHTKYDDALNQGFIKIIYLKGDRNGWIWVIPVGRNHLSIGIALNNAYIKNYYNNLTPEEKKGDWKKDFYLSQIGEAVDLKPILKDAEMEHKVISIGDYSYYTEEKYGDNYALIGDSAAFLDPIFSSGIHVGLESAKRVASAVNTTLNKSKEEGKVEMEKAYKSINGAYKLIEKLVYLFYDPELLKFSKFDNTDDFSFEKFYRAYSVFYYLLAGDFFDSSEKYEEFLDSINSERRYNRFIDYINKNVDRTSQSTQEKYTFEEVYGHLTKDDIAVPLKIGK